MFRFKILGTELAQQTHIKTNHWGSITAAKITSPELYELLKSYYKAAKSPPQYEIYIDGEYEGDDWYMLEGEAGDRDSPSTWRLESLSYKKKQFEEFCAQFEERD